MNAREIPGLNDVLRREVYDHCLSATDREVGGVLIGSMHGGAPPRVEASIAALHASQSAAELTFTQDAWENIHRVLEQEHPSLAIVGWYHTHPGLGVFLSEQDRFIHRNFFQNRSQIALVIDPIAQEEAVFAWAGNDIAEYYRRHTSFAPPPPPRRGGWQSGPRFQPMLRAPENEPEPRQGSSTVELPLAAADRNGVPAEHPPLTSLVYLAIVGLSAGVWCWELLLR